MTRHKGLATLDQLVTEGPTTVQLLRIDGQLRLFLSPREVAALCGVDYQVVLSWIHDGLIDHARDTLGTAHYPIPVRELAKLEALAKPVV